MSAPKAGLLPKQGPLATLENFEFNKGDRFLFNGNQFVLLTAGKPKVIEASARVSDFISGNDVSYTSFSEYKDSSGVYRFINGNPTNTGVYTGKPSSSYDHVVIGYDNPIIASEVKFWTPTYIPVEYIGVDYSYDGEYFYDLGITSNDVSYTFDDSIRVYSDESTSLGMYIYTVTLDAEYTAKYWRIRSFIYNTVISKVTSPVADKDITISSASRWPNRGSFSLYKPVSATDTFVEEETSYSSVSYTYGDTVTSHVVGLRFSGDYIGTVDSGAILKVYEERYEFYEGYWWRYEDLLGYGTFGAVTVSSSPYYVDADVTGYVPVLGGDLKAKILYSVDSTTKATGSYTLKSSTALKNISVAAYDDVGEPILAGSVVKFVYNMDICQVLIGQSNVPVLKFWETDGDKCSSKEVVINNIYDAVYDVVDGVYYVVGFSDTGGSGAEMTDDFSTGDSDTGFDSNKWLVSGNGFTRDDSSSALLFESTYASNVTGLLRSKAHYDSGIAYTVSGSCSITKLSGKGYIGIVSFDEDTNNTEAGIYAIGPWDTKAEASYVSVIVPSGISCYTENNASIVNLSVDPYGLPEFYQRHTFTYDGDSWLYDRVATGSSYVADIDDQDVGVGPYISVSGLSLEVSYNDRLTTGSFITFLTSKATVSGVTDDKIYLFLTGTTGSNVNTYAVDNSTNMAKQDIDGVYASSISCGIHGFTNDPVDLLFGPFVASSGYDSAMPSLYVKAISNDGELQSVTGVTNDDGVVIASLDVINNSNKEFGDYVNKVFIASDQFSESNGGSLYITVLPRVFKYNKTTLPLLSVENGSNAVATSSGITDSNIYNFAYDGYYNGGLSYEVYDEYREGVFLKSVDRSTLEMTGYEAQVDVSSLSSNPLAVDPSDLDTLYVVSSNSVYVFNIDENAVAFCDVTSLDPVIPAGSDYSTTIKAYVTNLYGDALQNKTVYFSVTSGDGSVSPAYDCTTSSGTAEATYTAGESVGISIITATATNDACV